MKTRLIRARALAVLLLVLVPAHTGAGTVDLWSATVPVADQSDAERERGFRAGLSQIAVRLTGQRAVLADPGVVALAAQAPQLVARYNYATAPGAGPEAPPELLLQVSFAAAAVDDAVRKLHLPLWPAQRPQVLLLVAGSEADSAAALDVARRVLAERGVPVLEPLGDLEDRRILGPTPAGLDADRIGALARRYGAKQWLELAPAGNGAAWSGGWRLGGGATPLAGTATGDSLAHWVESAVGDAVDRLAARLAYLPGTGSADLPLVVEGLANYRAYRAVLDTLGAMEFVRQVEVTGLHADRLGLELRLDGDPGLLWAALDTNPRFSAVAPAGQPAAAPPPTDPEAPATEPEAAAVSPPARHYRWREP